MPWTFPPPTFEIADKSADKSADKVCLDMCLTNLFKNADARAAKIVQNADKSCLPKLQTKFVYSRQGLSILELALLKDGKHEGDGPPVIGKSEDHKSKGTGPVMFRKRSNEI